MKILVTGGAGFIGSHLIERSLKEGYEITCLDNFNDYYSPEIKRNNVKPFLKKSNFKLVEADIRDKDALKRVFERFEFHKVIHLAAQTGVRSSLKEPSLYMDVNVNGTLNLLELSKEYLIKSFVFGSSSSVYGATKEIPSSEEGELKPISPYGVSKRAGELLCSAYNHLHHLPITILRFFTVYGPRQRPDMAIHKFTKLIEEGKEICLYGDGKSKRDYTYISDIIGGIMSVLNGDFYFQIFNLGNSEPINLSHLVSLIEKYLSRSAKIRYLPEQLSDPFTTYADISKSRRLLNYHPKVKIEKGIERFVQWYKYEKP
ncbi:MAG: GDP-mannose 4,6-dehydratase [Candidatus Methylarchaceae archaeon HK01B]|nr:GDP-mannose 4,6-dehydratase [Candidatus Methylarchaceae archaeon HK02M1]MCP8319032.1 GDP-mannose 4,6-dehydratase [Candidatus Methylarchaceae archaeon HK01B]